MVLKVLSANPVTELIKASATTHWRDGVLELRFQAMSTPCRVLCQCVPDVGNEFIALLLEWIGEFESRYSRFLPGSLLSQINAAAGEHSVETDPQTDHLLHLCHELHFITRGALDPTALPVIKLWDWKTGRIPVSNEIADAMKKVGWRKVQRSAGKVFLPEKGMALDLGGIGKEYAVDYVTQLAISVGIESTLIDFGQDIRVHGRPTERKTLWHVGLEDPKRPGHCWAGLGIAAGAVATSGDYARNFTSNGRRYGHIIDPRSGCPVANGCLAVSVYAPHCTLAGALSTAAFVLGEQAGIALIDSVWNAEGCITTENGPRPSRRFYEYVASENTSQNTPQNTTMP